MQSNPIIHDVTDTALWVAVYRALETERADALFRDPLADRLAGERGRKIAASTSGSRYTAWAVVIRTCIIDDFIRELIADGVDTVINLGAGLDTRPYRMDIPESLRWIEVDFPHMIKLKEELLAEEKPSCRMERVKLDLSDGEAREKLFSRIGSESRKALILTEGVIPYLSPEQVASLAESLKRQPSFRFWILDYYSARVVKFFQSKKWMRQMRNAPFLFYPEEWFEFFSKHGWKARETRYFGEKSLELGRAMPMPWWARILMVFAPERERKVQRKFMGYSLLEPIAD